MHVCGDNCGGQVCQISLELHLQAVVNCPVLSGRRASTLAEPPRQASPPTFTAEVCLGLKDAEAKLTGVPGTIAFFRFLAKRRGASIFYFPRPQAFTLFIRILDLPQTFNLTWQMLWGAQVLTSETAVYVVGAASQKRTLDAPYEGKPRTQLASTSETCSFKFSRKLALSSREQWLEIFQTWWRG